MRIVDILTVDRVVSVLDVQDKNAALRAMAKLFASTDWELGEEDIYKVLADREVVASTGVGSGVAIPHGRVDGLSTMRAALAICPKSVDFDAIDGEPVRILVAVLAPNRHTGDHLKALARISRLLRDESVRMRLLRAQDAVSLHAIVAEEDARH
ncbi:MAG: PTS sugar transporter subunit IIA [Sandaracinaceae bacterium]|nr:PTS sugar transporter subunit IIA [Sandaracinaceae bacterium]